MRIQSGWALGVLLCLSLTGQELKTHYQIDFGPHNTALYSDETGYGFEPGSPVQGVEHKGKGFVTSDKPFFFSAAVPEGNYRVMVTLGDAAGESTTTIKAELRRLMIEKVHTARGQFQKVNFIVNVRNSQIANDGE